MYAVHAEDAADVGHIVALPGEEVREYDFAPQVNIDPVPIRRSPRLIILLAWRVRS